MTGNCVTHKSAYCFACWKCLLDEFSPICSQYYILITPGNIRKPYNVFKLPGVSKCRIGNTLSQLIWPTRYLLVQSQQWKQQSNVWNLLTIKTPKRRQWYRFGAFVVNFEQISKIVLLFLLLTLNKYIPTGNCFLNDRNIALILVNIKQQLARWKNCQLVAAVSKCLSDYIVYSTLPNFSYCSVVSTVDPCTSKWRLGSVF